MDYCEFTDSEIRRFYARIAENVKYFRKQKGFTQLNLALAMGHKSMSTIAKIEANLENKHYNIEQLYKISKILEVELCEFFAKRDEADT